MWTASYRGMPFTISFCFIIAADVVICEYEAATGRGVNKVVPDAGMCTRSRDQIGTIYNGGLGCCQGLSHLQCFLRGDIRVGGGHTLLDSKNMFVFPKNVVFAFVFSSVSTSYRSRFITEIPNLSTKRALADK